MLSKPIADEFRAIVGEEWFLDSPEDLICYAYDGFLPEFKPDAVLVPGSTDEISRIVSIANREKINIIPRGAGTNICGGSVARQGGVILTFHRLNKILEIDREPHVGQPPEQGCVLNAHPHFAQDTERALVDALYFVWSHRVVGVAGSAHDPVTSYWAIQ